MKVPLCTQVTKETKNIKKAGFRPLTVKEGKKLFFHSKKKK